MGGTHVRTAVVTPDGRIHQHRRTRTPVAAGGDAIAATALEELRATRDAWLSDGGAAPVAVGISAPGPLDPRTGRIIDPPNLGATFHNLELGPKLADPLGIPFAMERDTNVAVLGERAFGAARGTDDVVYLTVSTGIGGAVVTGGRLLSGPDGVAGELGHLSVDYDGPICGCGGVGHLERLAAGSGMARSAREALDAGAHAPELARIAAAIAPRPLEAVHVDEAAALGDPVACSIVDRAVRAFAAAMVSIVDVFDPDRVVVGGGIALAWGDRLLGPAREAVVGTAFRLQARRVRIVPAELGDDVGLIGTVPLVATALPGWRPVGHAASDDIPATGGGARHA
ncbi:MAG: ROK family protein [Chloroflexota bacterium]